MAIQHGQFRKYCGHLEHNWAFQDAQGCFSVDAYVTHYGTKRAGLVNVHLHEQVGNDNSAAQLYKLKEKIETLASQGQTQLQHELLSVEELFYRKQEGIPEHCDGPQCYQDSPIYSYNVGNLTRMLIVVGNKYYMFKVASNTLYGFEVCHCNPSHSYDIPPCKLLHSKQMIAPYDVCWQIASIFRSLKKYSISANLKARYFEESKLVNGISWDTLLQSKVKVLSGIGPISKEKKLYPIAWILNAQVMSKYVLHESSNSTLWEPHDEFGADPFGTYALGLHKVYLFGNSYVGSKEGTQRLRLGSSDILISKNCAIYFLYLDPKQLSIEGRHNSLLKTFQNQSIVRILLASNCYWYKRKMPCGQYYFNNMFVHMIQYCERKGWYCVLRNTPLGPSAYHFSGCSCCGYLKKSILDMLALLDDPCILDTITIVTLYVELTMN